MENKERKSDLQDIFNLIYAIIFIVMAIYAVAIADRGRIDMGSALTDMSEGWSLTDGNSADVEDIKVNAGENTVILKKTIPNVIVGDVALCFMSHNVLVKVLIDGDIVYTLNTEENFTGYGYGDIRNIVRLTPADSGKELAIELDSVFKRSGAGYITDVCIGDPGTYTYSKIKDAVLPLFLSGIIIFFGLLFVAMFMVIPNKEVLPYNVFALGIASILLGIWCVNTTGVFQVLSKKVIMYRLFDYLAILFAEYPAFYFVNSFTHSKKKKYNMIAFIMWICSVAFVVTARFAMGIDMHNLMPFFYASYALFLLFMVYILAKDRKYCKENAIKTDTRNFNIGTLCFIIGALIEEMKYIGGRNFIGPKGTFVRLGLCIFIFEMLLHFLQWLASEQQLKKQLISYGYNDLMTGTGNRRALEEFVERGLGDDKRYAYVMCDVNGLKKVNDSLGHESGDALIKDVALTMINVFGKDRVYRLGGDEFAAFSFARSEDEIKEQIGAVNALLNVKGRSASIGYVFCDKGSIPFAEVQTRADKLMYEEKERYYQGRNDRRAAKT
ncbi:MAG: GGDEF domain-containing protein [Lachnospiraceae bacterium]|nr:GGDEF domain-containing protein [Lachnospiraceae bacterium]